jgi:cell shape-determining protein MreC
MTENLLAERGRLLQENEQLKKNVRELTERQQAEAGSLAQENERLRLDLQRLKALEIELEKRERMLR